MWNLLNNPKLCPFFVRSLQRANLLQAVYLFMRKLKTCGTNTIGEKLKLRENIEYSQRVCMLTLVLHLHHRWLYPLPYLCLPTVPSNLHYLMCHPHSIFSYVGTFHYLKPFKPFHFTLPLNFEFQELSCKLIQKLLFIF